MYVSHYGITHIIAAQTKLQCKHGAMNTRRVCVWGYEHAACMCIGLCTRGVYVYAATNTRRVCVWGYEHAACMYMGL